MSSVAHEAWQRIATHYQVLMTERAAEGPAIQLACLVLAEYCTALWNGEEPGPSLAMVALAEHALGDRVDEVVAAEMTRLAQHTADARKEALS